MKVRLAKKIIKKKCRYWEDRRVNYGYSLLFPDVKVFKKRPPIYEGKYRNEMEIHKGIIQKKQSLVPCFFRIIRQRSFYHPKLRHRSSPGACHGVP